MKLLERSTRELERQRERERDEFFMSEKRLISNDVFQVSECKHSLHFHITSKNLKNRDERIH